MKSNFTLLGKAFILLALSFSSFFSVYSQCAAPSMVFHNPVLVSGINGQKDAKYKFSSVTPGVDAYLTILNLVGGATLIDIDNTAQGYDAAWQPTVRTSSTQSCGECYISWKLEFFDAANGNCHTYPCFILSFIDVDGDNSKVREFVEAKLPNNFTLSTPTDLTISADGQLTKALGPIKNFADIDTSSWSTNINYNYSYGSKVEEIRTGINQKSGFSAQNRLFCSYFTKTTPAFSIILPVKYTSFTAVASDQTTKLKWVTEEEMNNDHFEVERSVDGLNFSTVGYVTAAEIVGGNKRTYEFSDNLSNLKNNGTVYYRLKQIDRDGNSSFSKTLSVQLNAKAGMLLQVSPNPFIYKIDVRFEAKESGNSEIRVTNLAGQTVISQPAIISKGYNNLSLNDLGGLSKGMYIVQVMVNGVVNDSQKIIKN
jgi:hypothetical protein